MKLLLDANIILEVILNQERAQEARLLLSRVDEYQMTISLFSLHTIGVTLVRQKRHQAYRDFLAEMVTEGKVLEVLSIESEGLHKVPTIAEEHHLDFDDAYQYVLAEKYNLPLVSFDDDFDPTKRGKKTPAQILQDNLKPPVDSGEDKEPGSGTPLANQLKDQSKEKNKTK